MSCFDMWMFALLLKPKNSNIASVSQKQLYVLSRKLHTLNWKIICKKIIFKAKCCVIISTIKHWKKVCKNQIYTLKYDKILVSMIEI